MTRTLACFFWHTPAEGHAATDYEAALIAFHGTLAGASASFRLARLPFRDQPGYEDCVVWRA